MFWIVRVWRPSHMEVRLTPLNPLAGSRIGVHSARQERSRRLPYAEASEHLSCSRSPALRIYAISRPWALVCESTVSRAHMLDCFGFRHKFVLGIDSALCCAAASSRRDPWRCRVRHLCPACSTSTSPGGGLTLFIPKRRAKSKGEKYFTSYTY